MGVESLKVVPFPEPGNWYIGFQLSCRNFSTGDLISCPKSSVSTMVSVDVNIQPCDYRYVIHKFVEIQANNPQNESVIWWLSFANFLLLHIFQKIAKNNLSTEVKAKLFIKLHIDSITMIVCMDFYKTLWKLKIVDFWHCIYVVLR